MSTFRYERLDSRPTPSTRFIEFEARSQSNTVYTLDHLELDLVMQYTAISYMWGPSAPMQSILMENATVEPKDPGSHQIGKNLYDFLEAHKTYPWGQSLGIWRPDPGYLWIDQICVDQNNLVERNDQVNIMNLIYKKANKVLVWLGCEPDMAEAAQRLRDKHSDNLEALARLLRHPYFSRLWIVQEVSLSTKVFVVCREVEFEWGILVDAVNRLNDRHMHSTLVAGVSQSEIPAPALALICEPRESRTLQRCIASFCRNGCQDPRDKVYALLGLTSERWRVRVDYRKPVFDVYVETVKALFEELFDRLEPLCFYKEPIERESGSRTYIDTILALAEAMDLPQHHIKGLPSFLKDVLEVYLNTPLRNVEYPYKLSMPPRRFGHHERYNYDGYIRGKPTSKRDTHDRETYDRHTNGKHTYDSHAYDRDAYDRYTTWLNNKFPNQGAMAHRGDPRWKDVTVTRRNPLIQDVIPAMGLKVAQPCTEDASSQGRGQGPVLDQWWFEYDGHVHYFDCPT